MEKMPIARVYPILCLYTTGKVVNIDITDTLSICPRTYKAFFACDMASQFLFMITYIPIILKNIHT